MPPIIRQIAVVICLFNVCPGLYAQTSEGTLEQMRGREIINFTLTDVVSNQVVSLRDFSGSDAIVLIFTCIHCPYAKIYEDRIQALYSDYRDKNVDFILINSNTSNLDNRESVEKMKIKAAEESYEIPYLADKEGIAKNILMAEKTPEAFVVIPGNDSFMLAYRGAIDDNPQFSDQVNNNYIRLALNNIMEGKPSPISYKRPVGCRIKSDI